MCVFWRRLTDTSPGAAGARQRVPARAGRGAPRARAGGAQVMLTDDAQEAARGADVLVTDTWISMGQADAEEKRVAMLPYQVNGALMELANKDALFLHCLPAHVGEEVSHDVFESEKSVVFDEAENRIHAQKSVLLWSFGLLG